jgi:hypothetical protein
LGDRNADKKTSLTYKLLLNDKFKQIETNWVAEDFVVNAKGFFKQAVLSIKLKKA